MTQKVFICHASEDKEEVARPLAETLRKRRFQVWYDEYSLKVGDSLLKSIGRGLSDCDYGVVIFSRNSISKFWTSAEISGLFARESLENRKIILPIMHNISISDLHSFNPILSDRFSISTISGINAVASAVARSIREDQKSNRSVYLEYLGKRGGRVQIRAMPNAGDGTCLFGSHDIEDIGSLMKNFENGGKLIRKK